MNGNDSMLTVYLGREIIAYINLNKDELHWQYSDSWLNKGYAVSPYLSLSGDIPPLNVNRFLRNLLPEGYAFDELLQNVHVSRNNTFALVRALGLDTAGALILRPSEMGLPKEKVLRILTTEELTSRLDQRETVGLIIWDGKPRLSVAGIQDKINLLVTQQGQLGFAEEALCSTHILKFERQTQANLVINEYLTMRLAKKCGLKVADVMLQQYGENMALLVERFDRRLINEDEVQRRHIIDGCQALNLPPEYKYERNFGSGRDVAHIRDGASLPRLFKFADKCQNPALTKQQMLDWVLFNILIYNLDAHGKNISFFMSRHGISLAPFYDLVNFRLFPDVDQDFAMALGDEFESNSIHAYQIADFAESCHLSRVYVAKCLKQAIEKIMHVLPQEISKIIQECGNLYYFSEYQKIVTQRCQHFLEQCSEIPSITL